MEDFPASVIPEASEPIEKQPGTLRFFIDLIETLVLAIVLFVAINAISARIRVDGSSMEPSLYSGEFIIVNRLAFKLGKPHIGDVIVFRLPRDPKQELIKRIIGLPGDEVSIGNGNVFVNGQQLQETYIAAPPAYHGTWQVPEGQVFVLGDNRNNSSDSHSWGSVPLEDVVGKAIVIYWPPQKWEIIQHNVTIIP